MAEQTSTRPEAPQVESIWLTRTSVKPIWLAFTILLTFGGLFAFIPLMIVGGVASVIIALAWATEARAESDELPRG